MAGRAAFAAALTAALLAACGAPKPLTLPTERVDRAATCGVVATAAARRATADIKAPLPIAAEGRILHYAILGASEGGPFSSETAGVIVKRMATLEPEITSGKWQDLEPACKAAFPDAEKADVALPKDRLDAQLGCSALAAFTATTLEPAKAHYAAELADYRRLRGTLGDRIGPALRVRVGGATAAQRRAEGEAMAKIARAGSPVAVLAECARRFGS
jgi:hypothetical protein